MTTITGRSVALALVCTLAAPGLRLLAQSSEEDVARRQLESGRSFLKQGNYTEALKDFRAVAETHASSSVADDALLEIAKYYFEIAEDYPAAATAVDEILKKYATSNSAPDAYVISGRLALAKSHQGADLDAAVANFDRVTRLFPTSTAVPSALEQLGEASAFSSKYDESLAYLGRVEAEYPTTSAAADAYLMESRVLVARGDAVAAMEELQQVRNRFPGSPQAAAALARTSILYRLYVKAKSGLAYAQAADSVGPPKIENLVGLALTPKGALYFATETGISVVQPPDAPKPPAATRPRALMVETTGGIAVLEQSLLHPSTGEGFALPVLRAGGYLEALNKASAAAQLSNGDWVVSDESEKFLHRYSRVGKYGNVFSSTRLSKLAVNGTDEVAGIDKDGHSVTVLDSSGKTITKIPFKGAGYELQNPEDVAFDAFGHLYVLDHTGIAVFSPFAEPAAPTAPTARPAAAAPTAVGAAYHLLTYYSEPDKAPGALHKATAFAIDRAGTVYVYDDRAQRILVYR
jgi:outer membrane protein assembly factor BamD